MGQEWAGWNSAQRPRKQNWEYSVFLFSLGYFVKNKFDMFSMHQMLIVNSQWFMIWGIIFLGVFCYTF